VKFLEKKPNTTPNEQEVINQVTPPELPLGLQLSQFDGSEIESVVILPKGFKTEYPVVAAMQFENANLRKQVAALEAEKKVLAAQTEESNKAVTELKAKLSAIDAKQKETITSAIASLRIENGALKQEDKESTMKTLSALPVDQLTIILEDNRKLSKKKAETPSPEIPAEDADTRHLSDAETKKRELRKKLFGYEEIGGVKNG